jgi:hypothetical protein
MRTVEVGTISYANDSTLHFIVFATNNGYQSGLTWVPQGFLANGQVPYGTPGGSQVTITVEVMAFTNPNFYPSPGYWVWVSLSPGTGGWAGYYPISQFSGPFTNGADNFQIGGEVVETPQPGWISRMGSGADPHAGSGQATYFSGNRYRIGDGSSHSTFIPGQSNGSQTGSTVPTDYGIVSALNGYYAFYAGSLSRNFWGTNYGYQWNPLPNDWAGGEYKGECYNGAYLTGLSKYTSGSQQAHAVQCGPDGKAPSSSQCYPIGFHNGDHRIWNDNGWEWDQNYFKGECGAREIVQGVAQTTSGYLDTLLCCPLNVTAHGQSNCNSQVFYSSNSSGYGGVDWDYYTYKGECPAGQYVAGVSIGRGNGYGIAGSPHALLCCTP